MAPEVITSEQQGNLYDHKADIWSLGITAIEMAEMAPPMFDLHPMRVLFMIPKINSPKLKNQSAWSKNFHSFLSICLEKNADNRPTADELLSHPFVNPNPNSAQIVQYFVKRSRAAKKMRLANIPAQVDDDDDEIEEDIDIEDYETQKFGNENSINDISNKFCSAKVSDASNINLSTIPEGTQKMNAEDQSTIKQPKITAQNKKISDHLESPTSEMTDSVAFVKEIPAHPHITTSKPTSTVSTSLKPPVKVN